MNKKIKKEWKKIIGIPNKIFINGKEIKNDTIEKDTEIKDIYIDCSGNIKPEGQDE